MALQAITELVLAALFLVAGVTKLQDLAGSKEASASFGVPKALIPAVAILLPALEIALALALLWPASFHIASKGTAMLTLVFLGAIIYQLGKGRKPECHCFGQLYSKPLSGWTAARNATILAGAVWLATQAPLPANPLSILWTSLATITPRSLNVLVLAIFCSVSLIQTFFLLEVMKQNGRLMLKLEQLPDMPRLATAGSGRKTPSLPVGSVAPEFELPSVSGGQTVSLRDLRSCRKSTLLVFSDPGCGPCQTFMPELVALQSAHQQLLNIVVISRGEVKQNIEKAAGLPTVLLQKDREVMQAYGCDGTPGAVLVGAHGRIDSDIAHGSVQIGQLVSTFVNSK